MKYSSSLLITFCSLILLCVPASASIDELAFGDSPAAMVYLFALNEVRQTPDSPYTLKRVNSAVAFCKGKVSDNLVGVLQDLASLIKAKKYAQAKKDAKGIHDEIYGE